MKNRIISLYLIAVLVICILTGCTQENSGNATNDATELGTYSDKKVGVCIYQLSDDFMSLFRDELVKYLKESGFSEQNITVYGSSNDEQLQLAQIMTLIDDGADALIVNPVNASAAHSITEVASAANVPLVYINREPSGEEENRWEEYNLDVSYVGCDARQSGIYQGELIINLGMELIDKNNDGLIQYYMIEGAPENIDAGYRTMYSVSTIKNAGLQMACLLDEVGNWDERTANLITAKGLAQGLIPEVIICNNDAMALGAIDAVKGAGLTPGKDVYIVGVDALPEALEKIKEGSMVGTVFNDYISQSHSAADAIMNYLDSKKNEHYISCNYMKVNVDNVDEIQKTIAGKVGK